MMSSKTVHELVYGFWRCAGGPERRPPVMSPKTVHELVYRFWREAVIN